jgi:tripartite-type tricarboxylate transporter receptor subunit TctC
VHAAILPTIAEAGLSGFDADIWFGFMGPAGLPRDLVARLNAELNRIVKLPDVAKWTKVVRDGNIKPE